MFGTMKNDSLSSNTFSIEQLFVTKTSSKMATAISQKLEPFLPKDSTFCIFLTIRFCSNFTSMWFKCLIK